MKVSILRLPHAKDLPLPAYATAGAAGLDLLAAVETDIELVSSSILATTRFASRAA
jgi:dUTP pyrophosphatase